MPTATPYCLILYNTFVGSGTLLVGTYLVIGVFAYGGGFGGGFCCYIGNKFCFNYETCEN